jgi:acyl-CoA reductase-like NAD-dependent aldehyde dehydrogenase
VAAIAPWNAALALAGRAIAGPLALGNTVVLKPSEESPWTGGALWAEIFTEAGLPPGALNVVTHAPGDAGRIGTELMADPRVRRINFTGSTITGRRLAETAGRHLKRVLLQLSGLNPLLVLADADLDSSTRDRSACAPAASWWNARSPRSSAAGSPRRPPHSRSATRRTRPRSSARSSTSGPCP